MACSKIQPKWSSPLVFLFLASILSLSFRAYGEELDPEESDNEELDPEELDYRDYARDGESDSESTLVRPNLPDE